jgi:hypothetical protein
MSAWVERVRRTRRDPRRWSGVATTKKVTPKKPTPKREKAQSAEAQTRVTKRLSARQARKLAPKKG